MQYRDVMPLAALISRIWREGQGMKSYEQTWFGMRGHQNSLGALETSQHLRDFLPQGFPEIVTLCGSTRFKEEFVKANFLLTQQGKIVLSVGWFTHFDKTHVPTEEEKVKLDELHFRKIDLSDSIFVVSVGGYIGSSTRNEIDHAYRTGKKVLYMEPEAEVRYFSPISHKAP